MKRRDILTRGILGGTAALSPAGLVANSPSPFGGAEGTAGQSRNFVFLHGGGQGSWVWKRTIAAMAAQSNAQARCLAIDVSGCGTKRGRDTSTMAYDDIARELAGEIRAAAIRDAVLVAHSRGGMLAVRMIELAQELFARVFYVSCSAPLPGRTLAEAMRDDGAAERPGAANGTGDPYAAMTKANMSALFCNDMTAVQCDAFLLQLGNDKWPKSSEIYRDWRYDHLGKIPAVFVHCLQDDAVPPAWQRRFAERLRVAKTAHIDAGHQAMITRPQALAEVLLAESAG